MRQLDLRAQGSKDNSQCMLSIFVILREKVGSLKKNV